MEGRVVRARVTAVRVVQINYGLNAAIHDPDQLLDSYRSLTGWSEALLAAGVDRVTVVQRFPRNAQVVRNEVEYVFRADDEADSAFGAWWSGRLHAEARAREADVVHINGLEFARQTWLLRRALPAHPAIVVQDHASRAPAPAHAHPYRWLRSRARYAGLRAADGFLFTSAAQADAWRTSGVIAARQRTYAVVESSTDMRPVPRVQARRSGTVRGVPAILWVGRLNAKKDPLTVLEGFERALDALPGSALTLVYQEDEMLRDVRARISASVRLQDRVRLAGRVPYEKLSTYYSAADLFVLGSHHEGSGYALLEACACGVVPVVTDIPAFRAITGDGAVGALWPVGDPSGCAKALEVVGRGNREALGRQVMAHFDRALRWDALGARAVMAYTDLMARRLAGA